MCILIFSEIMRLTSACIKESKGAYNFIRSRLGNGVKLTLAKNAHYKSRDFLCVLQSVSAIRDASIHSGGSFLKEYSSNDVPSDDQILRTLSSQEIDHPAAGLSGLHCKYLSVWFESPFAGSGACQDALRSRRSSKSM